MRTPNKPFRQPYGRLDPANLPDELNNILSSPEDIRYFYRHRHISSIYAHGAAQTLPPSETKPVSLVDFMQHVSFIKLIGLFITAKGLVISGDHAAALESPPPFAVLGDLHDSTLASILWNKVLPGYFSGRRLTHQPPLTFLESKRTIKLLTGKKRRKPIPVEDIARFITDKSSPIDWEVDLDPAANHLMATKRIRIEKVLLQIALELGQSLLQDELPDFYTVGTAFLNKYRFGGIKIIIRKGEPVFKIIWSNETIYGRISARDRFGVVIKGTLGQLEEKFGEEAATKHFLVPLLHLLESKINSDPDIPNFPYIKFCIQMIKEKLEEAWEPPEEIISPVPITPAGRAKDFLAKAWRIISEGPF